ncbi:MAG: hypothetical protein Q4B70_18445 [Lachnospiraceae bacterium]|nr:hypothetical protein [Lachnospiraceae bacterium]
MLVKTCVKRFIFPIVSSIVFFVALFNEDKLPGDGAGDAFLLLVILPAAFLSLFWAIYADIRDIYRVKVKGECMPEPSPGIFKYLRNVWQERKERLDRMDSGTRKNYYLLSIIGGALIVLGFVIIIFLNWIVVSTLIWIAGVTCFIYSSPERYNSAVGTVKTLSCSETMTIEELYQAFYKVDTTFGTPYIGKIRFVKGDSLIFGPDSVGEYIYIYKSGIRIYISEGYMESLILEQKTKPYRKPSPWDTTNYGNVLCYHMETTMLLTEMFDLVQNYLKTGKVQALEPAKKQQIYYFNEDFKLLGQRFSLKDCNRRIIYDIEGTAPLLSFRILEHGTGKLLFKITKDVVHMLPQYRFFDEAGKLYGSFEKKFVLTHDEFSMELPEGTLVMRQIVGQIGSNYLISINGENIGSIAERLNFTLKNLVFDNTVILVRDSNYKLLLTALAIMAARELTRDRDD